MMNLFVNYRLRRMSFALSEAAYDSMRSRSTSMNLECSQSVRHEVRTREGMSVWGGNGEKVGHEKGIGGA